MGNATLMGTFAILALGFNLALAGKLARSSNVFIIGGNDMKPYSRPYLVQLSVSGTKRIQDGYCGATIIDSNFVLTAAHCVEHLEPLKCIVRVTAAEHNISKWEGPEQRRRVADIFLHPNSSKNTLENDIALIKLAKPLDLSAIEVNPIGINTDPACPPEGEICSVAGWGNKAAERGEMDFPDVPNEVNVTAISTDNCNSSCSYNGTIQDGMICAGVMEGGKDSCQGDSGGPLVCPCGPNLEMVLTGIVSFGYGCAQANKPGVYARVSYYADWVLKTIADNTDQISNYPILV